MFCDIELVSISKEEIEPRQSHGTFNRLKKVGAHGKRDEGNEKNRF